MRIPDCIMKSKDVEIHGKWKIHLGKNIDFKAEKDDQILTGNFEWNM